MVSPIKLFAHARGPNPWRVAILLDELKVPYEMEFLDFSVLHTPVFEKHSPNGRVPAIVDPNTGITLWESMAIVRYLVETYDKENKFTYTTSPEKFYLDQYSFFQSSGQGPYFGQALWFSFFHSEQLPSAKERYLNEVKRFTAVLNTILEGKEYLVGEKCTYVDLAFVPWYWMLPGMEMVAPGFQKEVEGPNPNYKAWMDRLSTRPAVKKAFELREKKIAEEYGSS